MGNLKKRIEKIEGRLNTLDNIDQKTAFRIMIKIEQWYYGVDNIETISPKEWSWYVDERKRLAKKNNENLKTVEKEIEDCRLTIEKLGGFKS